MYTIKLESRVILSEKDSARVLRECVDGRKVYSNRDPLRLFCRALLREAFIQDMREASMEKAVCITIYLDHTIGELAREEMGA